MTVRTRVTAVAGVALTVAVALGLVILYLVQRGSARGTVENQLSTYAAQIEQSGQAGRWPNPLPASPLDANAEAQVLAADGTTVLAATRGLTEYDAVYTLAPGSDTPVRRPAVDPGLGNELQAFATHTTVDGHDVDIVTLTTTTSLSQINETFARLLLIGVPAILLLASGTVWLVVGRALRPVEQIRRTTTEITAADLSRRVPEPAARDEIGELARTMNGMLARIEDSAVRQRRFVADASHELRTPLAAIRTTLEVGLAHPEHAPWSEIAERVMRQSTRLESLVERLLLLARSDDRHLVQARRPVALEPLVREVCASTGTARVPVEFHPTAAAAQARVLGEPEQLERLLRNILDNAIRHARTSVALSVDAAAPDTVAIEIADDGPGIPAEERERVFDRFVRLDASRERGSGTSGLGLALAKEIAAAHGGSITIADAPGGGALVRIVLPRTAD
ncbi:HAMP domain-containing histidine kinase [Actinospica durhamensis]|uniref:histidine kinase n=1 Tax=Actinospica durhamensis TaxID=1508375 RepID=A0A941EQG4_9ACTN|nr:HAMP domain-containing sensor histidine kinase [Actinospica durhamensis]MBR7834652.1 HAMP domain-containing histidine kinase [Actinospica durhamensis]